MWVDDALLDGCDLAWVSDFIMTRHISVVSVPTNDTEKIWPWVENHDVRIFNRFVVETGENIDVIISGVARRIIDSFRHGADGAQIMIDIRYLEQFVNAIEPVRNDLFFDRDLVVGFNIDKVDDSDWHNVFELLQKIQPHAILITATGDKFDASSDFIGRVYSMFENWNFDGELHLMFGKNMLRSSQVLRLAQKMRPAVVEKILVFMQY